MTAFSPRAFAAEEGNTAAEGAGSGGTVQIFRNADAPEFDSIADTSEFSAAVLL